LRWSQSATRLPADLQARGAYLSWKIARTDFREGSRRWRRSDKGRGRLSHRMAHQWSMLGREAEIQMTTTIEDMRSAAQAPDWKDRFSALRVAGNLPQSKPSLEPLRRLAREGFKNQKAKAALDACRIGLYLDAPLFLREARRNGIFRASKFEYQGERIQWVVRKLCLDATWFALSPEQVGYLISVANLLELSKAVRATVLSVRKTMSTRRLTVIKSCLVCVDRAFRPAADHLPTDDEILAGIIGSPDHFSSEQMAAGFSLLLALYLSSYGQFPEEAATHLSEADILSGICHNLLKDCSNISEYREAETMLDGLPFKASADKKGTTVSSIDPRVGQSLRLGYIQTVMKMRLHHDAVDEQIDSIASLDETAERFHRDLGHLMVQRVESPLPRYVMAIQMYPDMIAMLASDGLFREEAKYLRFVGMEAFVLSEWLLEAKLVKGIALLDLVKLIRFFSLTTGIFFRSIDQPVLLDQRDGLDMRSRIPVLRSDVLHRALASFLGEDKAERLLEMLTYDPTTAAHFDVQYRPILKIGDFRMIPMGLLVRSNLVRNLLCEQQARLLPENGIDPMQEALVASLKHRGFLVEAGVKGKPGGKQLEIDVLAFGDDTLFIFECKNAFHPSGAQELRTSYDHIVKAAGQLTRCSNWLSSYETQKEVFRKLAWDKQPALKVRTCVATANRIFNGLSVEGHPVRQAHELLGVLDAGRMDIGDDSYRLWRGTVFQVADLEDYLGENGVTREMMDALVEVPVSHGFKGGTLTFVSAGLDSDLVAKNIAKRYPLMESAPQTPDAPPASDTFAHTEEHRPS
jgi:hypothetical protein